MKYEIQEIVKDGKIDNYRITQVNGDNRVATCYLPEHAELVCTALNHERQHISGFDKNDVVQFCTWLMGLDKDKHHSFAKEHHNGFMYERVEKTIVDLYQEWKSISHNESELYYIQNGYVGNAILWWGVDSKGYTTDLTKAGKYSREEASSIARTRPQQDRPWLCSYVDASAGVKLIVDAQYLSITKQGIL